MPLGTAMNIVADGEARCPGLGFMPLWNMWWPHTRKPSTGDQPPWRTTIGRVGEQRLAAERRQDVADTMPNTGRIMMYTAGWL